MADECDILFEYVENGCFIRAEQMADLIASNPDYSDVTLIKVGVVRDRDAGEELLTATVTRTNYRGVERTEEVFWRFHITVAVVVDGETWVIDPSLADGPISIADWAGLMGATEEEVETLTTDIYIHNGSRWVSVPEDEQFDTDQYLDACIYKGYCSGDIPRAACYAS